MGTKVAVKPLRNAVEPSTRELLQMAPALSGLIRGMSADELSRLAELWEEEPPLKAGESLKKRPPGVRLIVRGRMKVLREGWVLPGNAQVLGRGGLLGLEALVRRFHRQAMEEWLGLGSVATLLGARKRRVERAMEQRPGAPLRGPLSEASALEDTILLVLSEQSLESTSEELRAWLFRVYQANLLGEHIVTTIGRERRFANTTEGALFRLLESASLVPQDQPPTLRLGSIPEDFYVLLSGRCRIEFARGNVAMEEAMVCLGHQPFLLSQPLQASTKLLASLKAKTDPKGAKLDNSRSEPWLLVRIDGRFFKQLFQQDLGFQRAIYRGSPELSPRSSRGSSHQVLVLGGQQEVLEKLPRHLVAQCLAERLAVHLQEHVRIVHFTKEDLVPPPPRIPDGTTFGWVLSQVERDLKAPLPRPNAFTNQDPAYQGTVNVTLVDALSLEEEERRVLLKNLARQLARYPEDPLRLLYLANTAEALPPFGEVPQGVQLVPTAVLSDELPEGLAAPVHDAFAKNADLQERLRAILRAASGAQNALSAVGRSLYRAARAPESRPAWPLGTVRVRWNGLERLPSATPPKDALEKHSRRDTFDRWARAATQRRVGLALGGGGAFGYAHVPLILRLLALRRDGQRQPEGADLSVPLDMISGSSFGSVVGAFYCVGQTKGLELITEHWRLMSPLALMSVLTSAGMQWWLNAILGPVELDQLDIPFFPVVADADIGVEWDISEGTVGYGVRASGSMPPIIAPTITGNRRLLDGGIVANVPVNILRQAGADLLIASNPIALVAPRARRFSRVPLLGNLWRQLDPMLRLEDSFRMLQMLGRTAGESQNNTDDVLMYTPKYTSAWLTTMGKAQQIVEEANKGIELGLVVLAARDRWRSLLNNPVPRVVANTKEGTIELREDVLFEGEGEEPTLQSQQGVLAELVDFLLEQREVQTFKIEVTTASPERAQRQAERLKTYLEEQFKTRNRKFQIGTAPPPASGHKPVYSHVRLTEVEKKLESIPSLDKKHALERRSPADAGARKLELLAETKARAGEPDHARALALEAAMLDHALVTAQFLRRMLELRGSQQRRFEADAAATAMAWSPDGKLLAVGYKDGALRLWDVGQGRLFWQGPAHPGGLDPSINALAWHPEGHLLASCGNDFELRVWRYSDRQLAQTLERKVGTWDHWGLEFSPGGQYLLGPWLLAKEGGSGRSAAVFSVSSEEQFPLRTGNASAHVIAAAWAPTPRVPRFATVGDNLVILWEMTDGGPRELHRRRLDGAQTLAWKSDGTALAVGGSGACILLNLSDLNAGGVKVQQRMIRLGGKELQIRQVEWNQDESRLLAAVPSERALYVWDRSRRLQRILHEARGNLENVRCNPMKPEAALTWGNERVSVWNVMRGQRLAVLGGNDGEIRQAEWSPRGELLATVAMDGRVHVWTSVSEAPTRITWAEFESGKVPAILALHQGALKLHWTRRGLMVPLPEGQGSAPAWAAYETSLNRKFLVTRTQEGDYALHAWEPGANLPVSTKGSEPLENLHLSWSPDGTRVALREPERISIWDGRSMELLRACKTPRGDIRRLAWEPSGRWLAIALANDQVRLWDVHALEEPTLRNEPDSASWDITWHPKKPLLAIACHDARARVYTVADGTLMGEPLEFETRNVCKRVAWSPTGEMLATSDESGEVALWDVETGDNLLAGRQILRNRGKHLLWSPNGTYLLSVDNEGYACLWKARDRWAWEAVGFLEHEPVPIHWAAFSMDERWLVMMEKSGEVRIHPVDFETLERSVRALQGHGLRVTAPPVVKEVAR